MSADWAPSVDSVALDATTLIAVVESRPEIRDRIEGALTKFSATAYASLEDLVHSGLQRHRVVIVVLGPSYCDEQSTEQLGSFGRIRSGVGGVLVVHNATPGVMRVALRAGLSDAVLYESVDLELATVVEALCRRLIHETTARPPERPNNPPPSGERGLVTAVFSPKGGVGKSAVSVNLATALARESHESVALVDLDLQFGDVAVMLRMHPRHTVAEIGAADEIDEELVRSLLVEYEQTGLWILAAPTEPSMADGVSAHAVSRLIEVLRGVVSRIVIDTPPVLSDVILGVLDDADEIVFLVGMDVPSVKNARIGLHALRVVGIPVERVMLVLNRADLKVNLSVRDVERALERKVDVRIPSDVIVTQSINKGVPAVLDYERSQFARSLVGMAGLMRERSRAGVTR